VSFKFFLSFYIIYFLLSFFFFCFVRFDVTDWCVFEICSAKIDNAHKEFQNSICASLIRYVPEKGVLLVISRGETSRRRASLLQDMHFRSLSQKVLLLKRTEEAARQLESTKLATIGG
jgi:hypothetical protein